MVSVGRKGRQTSLAHTDQTRLSLTVDSFMEACQSQDQENLHTLCIYAASILSPPYTTIYLFVFVAENFLHPRSLSADTAIQTRPNQTEFEKAQA